MSKLGRLALIKYFYDKISFYAIAVDRLLNQPHRQNESYNVNEKKSELQ